MPRKQNDNPTARASEQETRKVSNAQAPPPKKSIKKAKKKKNAKGKSTAKPTAATEVHRYERVEGSPEREKARRFLEESFANAERRKEARLALEKRK